MFLVNKSNNEEVIELIYSGAGFCIVIDQEDSLLAGNPVGRIVRYGKKELKKKFKKIKPEHKYVKMKPINEEQKVQTIETFNVDKIGIMTYTEDYIEKNKYLDRREEIAKQTEADRVRLLKELADDYNPNGAQKRSNKEE
jgi:hypothetical protein